MTNREAKREIMLRQWSELVQECQCSGMSVKAWCEINNINTKTYYYRQAQVRKVACDQLALKPNKQTATFTELCPIQSISPQTEFIQQNANPCVFVKIANAEVSINSSADERTVAMVLKAVLEL